MQVRRWYWRARNKMEHFFISFMQACMLLTRSTYEYIAIISFFPPFLLLPPSSRSSAARNYVRAYACSAPPASEIRPIISKTHN